MASISSLGVGSGLDLSSILESLTAAQKATLTPFQISNRRLPLNLAPTVR